MNDRKEPKHCVTGFVLHVYRNIEKLDKIFTCCHLLTNIAVLALVRLEVFANHYNFPV